MISGLCARKKIIESTAWPVSQMEKAPGQAFVCGRAAGAPLRAQGRAAGSRTGKGQEVQLCPSPVPAQPGTAARV